MIKGDIVLIPFPFTDLSGHKVRPAVILYHQKGSEDCLVAFVSSLQPKKFGVHDIPLAPTERNGLKVKSTIRVSKIATLQKKIILGELGVLDPLIVKKIDKVLKELLKL